LAVVVLVVVVAVVVAGAVVVVVAVVVVDAYTACLAAWMHMYWQRLQSSVHASPTCVIAIECARITKRV
jgi:hypothetical protein